MTGTAFVALVCVAPLAAGCGGSPRAASSTTADDRIEFRFDWPESRVEAQWTKFAVDAKGATVREVTARYDLTVTRTSQGTLVDSSNFSLTGVKGPADAKNVFDVPAGLLPSGTAASDGTRFASNGFAGLRRAFLIVQRATDSERDARTEWLNDATLQDDALLTYTTRTWNALVGSLAGKALKANQPLVVATTGDSALPGSPQFPSVTTTTAKPGHPCVSDGPPTCVLVTQSSVPERPDQVASFVVDALRKHSPEDIALENLDYEDRSTSVVYAETLQPHRIEVVQSVRFRVRAGGVSQEMHQRTGWRLTLNWH